MEYCDIPLDKAYALLNTGGVVLVASVSAAGEPDIAPVAWVSPLDYEPTSQVLFVCDTGHRTLANIKETAIFALALPTWRQLELVEKAGSVSGREGDKYARLGIPAFAAQTAGLRIPEGVAGWLECRLLDLIDRRTACVVCGEVSAARAVDKAWMERLHMGGDGWYRPEPLTPDQTGAGGR